MKSKNTVILYICILQTEIFASITVRTVNDLRTYSEMSDQSTPNNLTCFPSADSSPLVFIHKLSRFLLVLKTANENKSHNYLCRSFSNASELNHQYQPLVMDLKVNETLPVYTKPVACSGCVPVAVLMPLLAIMVVSIVLNLHLLIRKRHRLKQKRIVSELKNSGGDTGSDESLLEKKEVSTVTMPDDSGKGEGSYPLSTNYNGKNCLYSHADRRRRVGSADSPLEDQKPRTDTIMRYKIPKIGFDNGSVLSPQASQLGREGEMAVNDNSAFRPEVNVKKVPYYPVFDEPSVEKSINQVFQSNGDSKDYFSKNGSPISGSVTKTDSQSKTNISNQDSQTIPTSNVSRGVRFHLPEPNDEVYHGESEGNVAVRTEQDIVGDTVSNLVNREEHYVVTAESKEGENEDKTSEHDVVNSLHEGSNPESNTNENEGFQPNLSFADVEENVADGDIQRLDNDSKGFQPDMSLTGRNVFQPIDDIPMTSTVNSRGFHRSTSSHSADQESPNYGIPSFYNDDSEGFQPNMSLKDQESELKDSSIPKIDNFGFQPEISLRGRENDPTNDDVSNNFGFQCELSDVNRERDSLPSLSPSAIKVEPSLNLGDSGDTSGASFGDDSKVQEPSIEPLNGRGRSNTIEEYNIPSVPFWGDSTDVPVVSASAATVDCLDSGKEDNKDTSIVFGASAHDDSFNTDSFA